MLKIVLSIAAALILCTVAVVALRPEAPKGPAPETEQLQAHLRQVSQWADSLKGLEVDEAKRLFGQKQPKETTWKYEDRDQPVLTYEFPGYDIELYCLPERVVMVSIDFVVD